MPFRKSDVRMNDGFAPLDQSRHMQQPEVAREIDLAHRCESGSLSFEEVLEDYPFDPLSAFLSVDYKLISKPKPYEMEHAPGCDISGEEAEDYWRDKIYGPVVEYEVPEMRRAA
jgi:hypothetical protein